MASPPPQGVYKKPVDTDKIAYMYIHGLQNTYTGLLSLLPKNKKVYLLKLYFTTYLIILCDSKNYLNWPLMGIIEILSMQLLYVPQ